MNAIDMASPLALNKAIWLKRPPSIEDEPLLAFDVSGIISPAMHFTGARLPVNLRVES
jgi:hypothetical protein